MANQIGPFRYVDPVPSAYKCGKCGGHGGRLWRWAGFFHVELLCAACVAAAAIAWWVLAPAVPCPDGRGWYGQDSIPLDGRMWWDTLPQFATRRHPS